MAWDRLRKWFVASRGGVAVNRVDIASLVAMGLGVVIGLFGIVFEPAGIGFFFAIVGFLTLVRHHPGGA